MRTVDCLFNTQGGMLDTATLRLLAESAAEHGASTLRFTSDQQIIIHGMMESRAKHLKSQLGKYMGELRKSPPNIASTAPVAGIGNGRPWLRKSNFTDILEKFDFRPKAKIVISDPSQPYLPAAYGQINFLADKAEDQWRVRILNSNGGYSNAAGVLRGASIAEAVRRIEHHSLTQRHKNIGGIELTDLLSDLIRSAKKETLDLPPRYQMVPDTLTLPHPQGAWDAGCLQEICLFALQHDITNMALTPWRSLALSRISDQQIRSFENFCFQKRIAPEQNQWRKWLMVDPGCELLASTVVKLLHQETPVNPGFALAIQNSEKFTDATIVVCPAPANDLRLNFRKRYAIWYRTLGSPRNEKMRLHSDAMPLAHIHLEILKLLDEHTKGQVIPANIVLPSKKLPSQAYRCRLCANEYSPNYGDSLSGVPAETSFENLPDAWACPVCEAPKQTYQLELIH